MHSHPNSTVLPLLQSENPMTMAAQPCVLSPRPASMESIPWETTTVNGKERLAVMRKLEVSRYMPHDYLPPHEQHESRFQQRRMTVEYLYRVVDFGQFQRDVVAYAVSHLMDRYLATPAGQSAVQDHNQYQLVALTSLYMAIKILEPTNISVDSLVPLANGLFSKQDFLDTEQSILNALNWCVAHGPTPLAFVQLLMPVLPDYGDAVTLYNHVQYQLELAVADYTLSRALPSDLAVVALWNALESMDLSVSKLRVSRRAILKALQYDKKEKQMLNIRIDCLQEALRQLMLATFSYTVSSQSCYTPTPDDNLLDKHSSHHRKNNSPVSVVRKEAAIVSPSASSSHDDSFSEVELIRFD